jgi:hypothetical protein
MLNTIFSRRPDWAVVSFISKLKGGVMEKVVRLICQRGALYLDTDAGSTMMVLPGGIIITTGFEDAPPAVVKKFSERLHVQDGILCLELKEHRGRIQQIPLAEVENSPALHDWLAAADQIIP